MSEQTQTILVFTHTHTHTHTRTNSLSLSLSLSVSLFPYLLSCTTYISPSRHMSFLFSRQVFLFLFFSFPLSRALHHFDICLGIFVSHKNACQTDVDLFVCLFFFYVERNVLSLIQTHHIHTHTHTHTNNLSLALFFLVSTGFIYLYKEQNI